MSTWLNRALSVEAAVESHREKRTSSDDEPWFLWTYLLPKTDSPAARGIPRLVNAFARRGFKYHRQDGGYRVFPADVGLETKTFDNGHGALIHLAEHGGGILMTGHGADIGLVVDPQGTIHTEIVRMANLDDDSAFGELSIWLPTDTDLGVSGVLSAEEVVVELIPTVEKLLQPEYGYSMLSDDLATIPKVWPTHREVVGGQVPSQVFWYQYFSRSYAAKLPLGDFSSIGFTLDEKVDGLSAKLDDKPSDAVEMLPVVRQLWRHSRTPTSVS